ncbi:hypothetical protein BKP37_07570 [Anaerobacillus alkalilacustris]|uniref:Uncharacterized protein n=1 Tax=Anaerobacillus alkalilacustris TaxID=393763 RepID=A0A1S2LR07_9BACI|nr:hypothetical protein [Anaerobacillus alkalilacustris]OIJ14826.1 hypothetical protein BKP37_07570 [Anaerobacillus alkalilacustris]
MEGIYFYWFVWIGWIYVTFILNKTKTRFITALLLLLLIIFSKHSITLFNVTLNISIILCLFIGYYLISMRKFSSIFYYLSVSFILTSSFVSFRLFQLYDPVWVMFHPTFKLSLLLLLLTLLLIKDQIMRISILFVTIAQGEIIFSLFLNSYVNLYANNQLESLDVVAISVTLTYFWFLFEQFVKLFEKFVKQKAFISAPKR